MSGQDDDNLSGWVNTYGFNIYANTPGRSVIVWKGYDDPEIPDAPFLGRADAGGPALTEFAAGLGLGGGQSLTLVGHSYGSTVIGTALSRNGLRPTNVVVEGSPGMAVASLSQLHLAPGQLYAEQAPGDPVPGLAGGLGTVPTDAGFGATRLKTNGADLPVVGGHSEYFNAQSQALQGIQNVISGAVPGADVQSPSVADRVGGFVGDSPLSPLNAIDPVRPALDAVTGWYHGPGSGALQLVDHVDDGAAHDVGHLTSLGVDTVVHPARTAGTVVHTIGSWL